MNVRKQRMLVTASALGALGWLGVTLLLPAIRDEQLRRELRRGGSANRIRAMISQGTNVELRDPASGLTPLTWAARAGDLALIRLLLTRGANSSARDLNGWTPLSHAAAAGNVEVLRELLLQSHPLDASGLNEALNVAASRGNVPSLKVLLSAGADPNIRVGLHGGTTLASAVRREDQACVRLLMAAGADPTIADTSSASPLDMALARLHAAKRTPSVERISRLSRIVQLLRGKPLQDTQRPSRTIPVPPHRLESSATH